MPFDFGGAIGGIGSFIGNQIGSALASQRAWKYAVKQNTLQYLTDKRQKSEYYEIMRNSLARGGYNPLLALGSSVSGNSSGGSFPLSDSDQGDQAINSAMTSRNLNEQNKLLKSQTAGQEKDNEIKELERKKLEADLTTSPKNIITEIINGDKNGTLSKVTNKYEQIRNQASAIGISLPPLPVTSAQSSKRVNSKYVLPKEKYTYVQKGVPKSVIKSFERQSGDKYKVKYVNPQKKKVSDYQEGYKSFTILPERPEWNVDENEVKRRMRKK